ncbi:hypothetical protein NHX12_005363 [Muraenolepis orangiensis]|uniref:F-actin monooxygenase n=1 Tax=Muraenolepis orangiensis TaxID=630683 RepID=A0A9Q0DQI7_9TELE|nr:hypothetical protein NHX12_005363 [Muraenolepis orangiensis]
MGEMEADQKDPVMKLFEDFVQAGACKCTLQAFNVMCAQLGIDPLDHATFYGRLKDKMTTWKAKALWSKLDKRFAHKEYQKGQACVGTKCLVIGGGPCGLRTAIELALMGSKVVVIEKRDSFSRNNVLHLWPFTIHDLRGLGAKKFYGKFCAGAIDHISIQQLQLMLLKIALLVALGWRAAIRPADHPVANYEFDVVIGADGRRNSLEGFNRTEFRGKLAIAITANFTNRNTTAEAKVEEISGVAFIFNQKFFLDLKEETGIDLENIVYYKDKTHYFVMTAKKQSLVDKGVIIHDYTDTQNLLCSDNVNQEALLGYAREAADFGTNYQLPTLDFAMNHYGQPDVAMFDFTSMHASEHAAVVRERHGHHLLVALVGDSLLEGRPVLELLAERESTYRLLPQTTPENLAKNFDQYTVAPGSRYPNNNFSCVRVQQVRHLYIRGELNPSSLQRAATIRRAVNLGRHESAIRPGRLLTWCQKQTEGYRNVTVTDLTSSWQSGLALCALIHRFRSQLLDFNSLHEEDHAANLQLALDIGEREFGIAPVASGQELSAAQEVDKTRMILYLSKFYELFGGTPLPASGLRVADENGEEWKERRHLSNGINVAQPRKRVPREERSSEGAIESVYKRRRKGGSSSSLDEARNFPSTFGSPPPPEGTSPRKNNRVRSMATQLQAKFEGTASCTVQRQSFPLYTDVTEEPPYLDIAKSVAPPKPASPQPPLGGEGRHSERDRPHAQTRDERPCAENKKAQTQHAREFHSKSIKEKAYHLSDLFSGEATPVPKGSVHRPVPQSADKCHLCGKRVYVVERICTEGLSFHRECFRCQTCSCPLRRGGRVFDSEQGKLFCKTHFLQPKNGTQRTSVHERTSSCGRPDSEEPTTDNASQTRRPSGSGTDGSTQSPSPPPTPPPGTLTSLLRKGLSWPLGLTRAIWGAPSQLSGWLGGRTRAACVHVGANGQDYAFLYELLSVGLPLLLVMQESLWQMYAEALPPLALSLWPVVLWLEDNVGLRFT